MKSFIICIAAVLVFAFMSCSKGNSVGTACYQFTDGLGNDLLQYCGLTDQQAKDTATKHTWLYHKI